MAGSGSSAGEQPGGYRPPTGASTDRGSTNTGSTPPTQSDDTYLTPEQQEAVNALIGGGTEPPEPEQPESWRDVVEPDPYAWMDVVGGEVATSLSAWAKNNGYPTSYAKQIYSTHAPVMFEEIQIWGFRGSDQMEYRTTTAEGLQEMVDWALNWFGGKVGIPLRRQTSGGGRGRGRGRGRSGPTAQDIRNQYDLQELTNGVNEMNRAWLFEDNPNAKKIATEYVDAMVASRGEKKLDFATFVEEKMKKTSRFKSIYRSKPEHLSPTEYMAPYMQSARAMAAPEDADDIAIQGAQMGAAPQDFQARLMREDSVTGSAPYIQGLESRLSHLNSVFAGS